MTVPVGLLNRVPRFRFEWLVPGLLRDKCIALVKGLPKDKRKQLVPVPDTVDRALAQLEPADEDLCLALARVLSRLGGVTVQAQELQIEKLDPFYRMNIRVVDADGKLLNQGRDLAALVHEFRSDTRQTITSASAGSPAREGLTSWTIGALPEEWRFRQAGTEIAAWPALVDKGESVAVELCDYPGQALLQHRLGVLRLLRLQQKQQVKFLRKQLLLGNETSLLLAAAGQERVPLVDDLIDAAWVQVAELNDALPRDEPGFQALLARSGKVVGRATELERNLLSALKSLAEIQPLLARYTGASWAAALDDMRQQLAALWQPGFQRDTPEDWLAQYPRYMKALQQRLERLNGQLSRDTSQRELLQRLATPLHEACARRPGLLALCAPARQYRWMLEEFRVSLFAQQLGTRVPVSDKRLQEQWQAVQAWLGAHPDSGLIA